MFPGGKADDQDFDDDLLPLIRSPNPDSNMRGAEVSAIREAFEEQNFVAHDQETDQIIDGTGLSPFNTTESP